MPGGNLLMSYLIHGKKHAVVYLANYRVGSTATAKAILDMGGMKIGDHHQGIPVLVHKDVLVVETVRHHCDVMVSWWFWRNSRMAFPKFVRLILDGHHGYNGGHRQHDRGRRSPHRPVRQGRCGVRYRQNH